MDNTAGVALFPEQASSIAWTVDSLYLFIIATTVFFGTLTAILLIYFAIRYRRVDERIPAPIEGSTPLEVGWSVAAGVLFVVIFVWSSAVYFAIAKAPDDAIEVYVTGRQWMWKTQHPDGQRDINALHVPVGQPVKLIMTSEDVIHSFFIPAFRTKHDVLPGRYTNSWFEATKPGRYRLFCAEYCGTDHSLMGGEVVVMEQPQYQEWLASKADRSLALRGRQAFMYFQCINCHVVDPAGRAPVLENLYNKPVMLQDNTTVVADESYIRESILNPRAKIVAGYQPIMPAYQGQMNEDQLLELVAFIKSLKTGGTPPKLNETQPPQPGEWHKPQDKTAPAPDANTKAAQK